MNQTKRTGPSCLKSALIAIISFPLLFSAGTDVIAQQQECGVGTQVQGNMGGGAKGTIAEIGTEPPHVGWYRIVFNWNAPKGDWYDPKTWEIRIAGTNIRCGQEPAVNKQQPQSNDAGTRTPELTECPMVEPPGKVTKTAPASAQLFKRVIYEWEAAKINPASISAPKKIGLAFLEFEMGKPYKNTLTSSRFGDKRRHDGAPEGAMIYPIKTKELQCELYDSSVKRWVTENAGNCFKNRFGEWTCPRRTTKFVENRLLPLK
ncbi:MAG TPA: hypothetical protein VNO70_04575 [Blastocatellia bacterium]|nr:hypothetical protein [Blastocatellia bacterium]